MCGASLIDVLGCSAVCLLSPRLSNSHIVQARNALAYRLRPRKKGIAVVSGVNGQYRHARPLFLQPSTQPHGPWYGVCLEIPMWHPCAGWAQRSNSSSAIADIEANARLHGDTN